MNITENNGFVNTIVKIITIKHLFYFRKKLLNIYNSISYMIKYMISCIKNDILLIEFLFINKIRD